MSTTDAALAPAAASATSRAGRLERWGDAVNPILVKEVRQALRGRYFRISFWLTLGAAMTLAVILILINAASAEFGRSFGVTFFSAMFFCLAAATHGLVPFSAFVSMGSEWEENTFDLLILSNLRPRQIVLGKILSAGVQALLFYSAFGPFLVLAFLLHGVDLLAAGVAVGGSVLLSLTLACFAVALSSLTRHKFLRVVLMGGLAALLVAASVQPSIGVTFMMSMPGEVHRPQVQQMIGMLLSVMLGFGGLCFAVACTRLAHPEENRSTSLRVWALVLLVCFLSWVTWIFDGNFGDEDVLIPCFFGTALLAATTFLFASEPERLGRRVRAQVPRSRALAWLAAPLLPGGARGFVFYLLGCGLLYAWAYGVTAWSNGGLAISGEELLIPPVLGLYALFFTTLPSGLLARRLDSVGVRILCRVATLLLLLASIFLPALYGFFVRDSDWMRFMHPFNPFAVVERLWQDRVDDIAMGLAVPITLGLLALAVNAPRLWRSYRELEEARAVRVARGR